jgi:hypothetical protein
MSDRVDPDRSSALRCTARGKPFEYSANCSLVVRDPLARVSRWTPFCLERQACRVPDALDKAARQAPYGRRTRTGVTGEDLELE